MNDIDRLNNEGKWWNDQYLAAFPTETLPEGGVFHGQQMTTVAYIQIRIMRHWVEQMQETVHREQHIQ